jgi:hypothetical protein
MQHSIIYQIAKYFIFDLSGPETNFLDPRLFEICPFQFHPSTLMYILGEHIIISVSIALERVSQNVIWDFFLTLLPF